jgi:hypothetical protein
MKAHHSFLDDGAYQNETSDRCRAAEALESYKLLPPSALNDSQTSSWTSGAFYLFRFHIQPLLFICLYEKGLLHTTSYSSCTYHTLQRPQK